MIEESGRRVVIFIGVCLLVIAITFGYIQNRQKQNYYTTPSGDVFFSDPDQTHEGETGGYYSILGSNQLLSKIGLDKFQDIRSKIEDYMNLMTDKPRALYYREDSFKLKDNGQASFQIYSVQPRYRFNIVFDATNKYSEVSVE
jgi:hypothetical protein